jgi:hypothetical protein
MSAKRTPKPELTVVKPVEETPTPQTPQTLDEMLAQKRQLDEQIKVAKAALPTKSKLEREIERQLAHEGKWISHQLIGAVSRRAKLGQDPAVATDEVLAFYRTVVLAWLAANPQDEAAQQ